MLFLCSSLPVEKPKWSFQNYICHRICISFKIKSKCLVMDHQAYVIRLLLTPSGVFFPSHLLPSNHSVSMSGFLHLLSLFMEHCSLLTFARLILSRRFSNFSSDSFLQKIVPWFPKLVIILSPIILYFLFYFFERNFSAFEMTLFFFYLFIFC